MTNRRFAPANTLVCAPLKLAPNLDHTEVEMQLLLVVFMRAEVKKDKS